MALTFLAQRDSHSQSYLLCIDLMAVSIILRKKWKFIPDIIEKNSKSKNVSTLYDNIHSSNL